MAQVQAPAQPQETPAGLIPSAVPKPAAVPNPAVVPHATAVPRPAAQPPADYLALLSPEGTAAPAAGARHVKHVETESEHVNVAVKAFELLLHRARRHRDVHGQPASFQFTLWCMVLLVVVVTAIGVVLLSIAAQRQREKLTSTTEPAPRDEPDEEVNDEGVDIDYRVALKKDISNQESTEPTDTLGEDDAVSDTESY
ncbi:hypothetical protein MTO96_026246, partial [Rhipicephalus appendiculatus]